MWCDSGRDGKGKRLERKREKGRRLERDSIHGGLTFSQFGYSRLSWWGYKRKQVVLKARRRSEERAGQREASYLWQFCSVAVAGERERERGCSLLPYHITPFFASIAKGYRELCALLPPSFVSSLRVGNCVTLTIFA